MRPSLSAVSQFFGPRPVLAALLTAWAALTPGCTSSPDGSSPGASASEPWKAMVQEVIESHLAAHPALAVDAGRHEFDGRLPDWSKDGIAREIARLHAVRGKVAGFSGPLDERQRFERDYIVARLDRDLFWLEVAEWPFKNPAFYFDWLSDTVSPSVYVTREYAPPAQRLQAFAQYARALATAAGQIRENLRVPLPRTYIDYGSASFGGLATYFQSDVPQAFAAVEDPVLQQELESAIGQAVPALEELVAWFEAQRPAASEAFALGKEPFSLMLRMTEGVEIDLARLEAVGRADLERNLKALEQACAELTPGQGIDVCMVKVQGDKPEGGAVEGARRQLEELKAFVLGEQLVTIPGSDTAKVDEAPAYARSNFAFINIPGPYEKGLPATYYISPPDPSWPKEEQLAYVPGKMDLLATSIHEVWPGHFLQYTHANRSSSEFGKLFVGYAFGEGWAHYSEEMMVEAGLHGAAPDVRAGQIINALLRNVRFLSTIGLHTKGMTVAESEKLFREKAFQDPGNARQQAARGTYDPAYLNYTMGKLMIRKLRAEWTATRGGRKAWREFHDTFLSYGGPPVPLVRKAMLGANAGPAL